MNKSGPSVLHLVPSLQGPSLEGENSLTPTGNSLAGFFAKLSSSLQAKHRICSYEYIPDIIKQDLADAALTCSVEHKVAAIKDKVTAADLVFLHWWPHPWLYHLCHQHPYQARLVLYIWDIGLDNFSSPAKEVLDMADRIFLVDGLLPKLKASGVLDNEISQHIRSKSEMSDTVNELLKEEKAWKCWGIKAGTPLLDQDVLPGAILAGSPSYKSYHPAQLFRDLLGSNEIHPCFDESSNASDQYNLIEAEQGILECQSKLANNYILPFADYFSDEPHLQLWKGLSLLAQHNFHEASIAFMAAISNGIEHWRVYWYAAIAALKSAAWDSASVFLAQVLERNAEHKHARRILNQLNNNTIVITDDNLSDPNWCTEVSCLHLAGIDTTGLAAALITSGYFTYWGDFNECWSSNRKQSGLLPACFKKHFARNPGALEFSNARPDQMTSFNLRPLIPLPKHNSKTLLIKHTGIGSLRGHASNIAAKGAAFETTAEIVNTPVPKSDGGLLCLGPLEEYFFQEVLCESLMDESFLVVQLDQLEIAQQEHLQNLLSFLEIEWSDSQIESFFSTLKQNLESSTFELDQQDFCAKLDLLRLTIADGPSSTKEVSAPWTQEKWEAAKQLWKNKVLEELQGDLGAASPLRIKVEKSLEAIACVCYQSELLQIRFAILLGEGGQSLDFAEEILTHISRNGVRFSKFAATAALNQLRPDMSEYGVQFSFFLNQLDNTEEHTERDFFLRLISEML